MTSAPTSKRTATERLTEEEQIRIRYAMLSVYYRSLGSQLETRGAPVVAVPPEVRPLSLADALEDLKAYPDRLWDAYWRIVRAVPVDGWVERRLALRYPTAFVEQLTPEKVEELDDVRRSSRAGAHLFAAALIACAESRWSEAIELAELIERHARDSAETQLFSGSTEAALGVPIGDFVRTLATDDPIRTARHLQQLQAEVGLNLYDFVQDFADTLAFQRFKEGEDAPTTALTSSCVVRQDTATLTTTATVTALISEPFEVLAKSIDPLGWPDYSDVIVHTARMNDGSRKITSITEVVGMEGDTVMLQDLFVFQREGVDENGRITGRFVTTGIRPRFADHLKATGQTVDSQSLDYLRN